MQTQSAFAAWLRRSGWAIVLIAAVQFILHLWVNSHDGIFRDELYYVAAGQHLSPGYVEYPPFVALVAAFSKFLFGTSVLGLRLLPAVAGAAMVLLVADMVAELGGGLPAQLLAGLAIALGPVFIGSSGILSMEPFDQLWWPLAAWVLLRMIKRQEPRMWLWMGVVIGFGLLTKLTMGFFVLALLAGLPLSGQRKLLFTRWLIFGGLIALVMLSPYLAWQAAHGFPVIEYTRIYSHGKVFDAGPVGYLLQQVLTVNPLALPLWLGGLYFLFFVPAGKPYRAFGWAYLLLYVLVFVQNAKFYWLSPAYPMLLASGAYSLERLVAQRPRLKWMQPAYLCTIVVSGLLLVPFAIPLLPVQTFLQATKLMGSAAEVKTENLTSSELPQNYADRYGWPELVNSVKQAYDTLTPEEKKEACVFAANYGEAGAIDLYGPALGLPKAISGHNSYFMWGPQGCTGKVLITVNIPQTDLEGSFESIKLFGWTSCRYCMPYENNAPILIVRGLKAPIDQVWPGTKSYS
ncbi:MAG: ArnT family glycosyltransferase [Anaerolineae bacterium]